MRFYRSTATVRAFSLVEILIAVIILALGLLGLGVVFPVVVREQKLAQDRITGTLAENNIRATLSGMAKLSQGRSVSYNVNTGEVTASYTGYAVLKEDWVYNTVINRLLSRPETTYNTPDFRNEFTFSREGLFDVYWQDMPQAPNAIGEFYFGGDVEFVTRDTTVPGLREEFPQAEFDRMRALLDSLGNPLPVIFRREFREFRVPLSIRLNPAGESTDDSPTMVWDFVVRRKMETTDPRALQVAVFVRRVDPQLRAIPRTPALPGNLTVPVREQFFSTVLATGQSRLPVGEDRQGLPTFNGTDGDGGVIYSGVHQVGAYFYSDASDPFARKRDRIAIAGFGADAAVLGQPGQRVVDNLGNIYTVVGFDGAFVKVDPPVPSSVLTTDADPRLTSIRQLIFTPQPPVAVFVLEIEP